MKRLLFVVLALVVSLPACSTVTGSFLQRGAKGPSEETVRAYIRRDDEKGARIFLMKIRPALPDAYIDELIVRAQADVAKERCEGRGGCAAEQPKPAPSPSPLPAITFEVVPTDEEAAQPPKE